MRTLDVAICFDVEDLFHPSSVGSDDLIRTVAEALAANGLIGNFFFIGARARLLSERGRKDVIASLRGHFIGSHTLTGAHPTMPEYCAELGWADGLREIRTREVEGLDIIREVFEVEPCALSRHADFTAPQVHALAAELGKPYVYGFAAAPPRFNLTWYCGALNLPGPSSGIPTLPATAFLKLPEAAYADRARFDVAVRALDESIDNAVAAEQPFTIIFLCHPFLLRCVESYGPFVHANGRNVPAERWRDGPQPTLRSNEQLEIVLANLRTVMGKLASDSRLNVLSLPEVQARYNYQEAELDAPELLAAARQVVERHVVVIRERFSPAELCLGFAASLIAFHESGRLPPRVARRSLLGPIESSPIQPELWNGLEWGAFIDLLRGFVERSIAQGHLMHQLHELHAPVGLGSLYAAMALAYQQVAVGVVPERVRFEPFNRYPEEARDLAHCYHLIGEQHPAVGTAARMLDPSLNTGKLARLAALQTWTMKPARAKP